MKKEKSSAQLHIAIRPSLLKKFELICDKNYKSVSGLVKELMVKYIEENKEKINVE